MAIPLIILVLIVVNAIYVAAEFATVSARRSRIHQLAQEGNRRAAWLLPIIEDGRRLDKYVAACQIGITFSSLVLGAYGQATLPPVISPLLSDLGGLQEGAAQATSATVILVGLTSLQVIFGELLPKTLSLQYTTQAALFTSLPMAASLRIFSWFIALLNGSGLAILRLVGAGEARHRHIHSPEEIELLLVESRDGGLLEPDEQERLHRALSFGEKPVRRLMVPRTRVEAIDANRPTEEIVEQVLASPYTRFPVFRGSLDNVVGVLHSKDLVLRNLNGAEQPRIEEYLHPAVMVPESLPADRVLASLREQHAHQAIVLDEFGGCEGLVTLQDLLLEVLDVSNSEGAPTAEKLADGRIRIPGSLRIDQAELWLGEIAESEAVTVGGYVAERLGHFPSPGEKVGVDGALIEVEAVAGKVVSMLLVTPTSVEVGQ